jgi:hypothetical protein
VQAVGVNLKSVEAKARKALKDAEQPEKAEEGERPTTGAAVQEG